ncbi:unnamed protein product, partial [Amoebophrya sp. A120]
DAKSQTPSPQEDLSIEAELTRIHNLRELILEKLFEGLAETAQKADVRGSLLTRLGLQALHLVIPVSSRREMIPAALKSRTDGATTMSYLWRLIEIRAEDDFNQKLEVHLHLFRISDPEQQDTAGTNLSRQLLVKRAIAKVEQDPETILFVFPNLEWVVQYAYSQLSAKPAQDEPPSATPTGQEQESAGVQDLQASRRTAGTSSGFFMPPQCRAEGSGGGLAAAQDVDADSPDNPPGSGRRSSLSLLDQHLCCHTRMRSKQYLDEVRQTSHISGSSMTNAGFSSTSIGVCQYGNLASYRRFAVQSQLIFHNHRGGAREEHVHVDEDFYGDDNSSSTTEIDHTPAAASPLPRRELLRPVFAQDPRTVSGPQVPADEFVFPKFRTDKKATNEDTSTTDGATSTSKLTASGIRIVENPLPVPEHFTGVPTDVASWYREWTISTTDGQRKPRVLNEFEQHFGVDFYPKTSCTDATLLHLVAKDFYEPVLFADMGTRMAVIDVTARAAEQNEIIDKNQGRGMNRLKRQLASMDERAEFVMLQVGNDENERKEADGVEGMADTSAGDEDAHGKKDVLWCTQDLMFRAANLRPGHVIACSREGRFRQVVADNDLSQPIADFIEEGFNFKSASEAKATSISSAAPANKIILPRRSFVTAALFVLGTATDRGTAVVTGTGSSKASVEGEEDGGPPPARARTESMAQAALESSIGFGDQDEVVHDVSWLITAVLVLTGLPVHYLYDHNSMKAVGSEKDVDHHQHHHAVITSGPAGATKNIGAAALWRFHQEPLVPSPALGRDLSVVDTKSRSTRIVVFIAMTAEAALLAAPLKRTKNNSRTNSSAGEEMDSSSQGESISSQRVFSTTFASQFSLLLEFLALQTCLPHEVVLWEDTIYNLEGAKSLGEAPARHRRRGGKEDARPTQERREPTSSFYFYQRIEFQNTVPMLVLQKSSSGREEDSPPGNNADQLGRSNSSSNLSFPGKTANASSGTTDETRVETAKLNRLNSEFLPNLLEKMKSKDGIWVRVEREKQQKVASSFSTAQAVSQRSEEVQEGGFLLRIAKREQHRAQAPSPADTTTFSAAPEVKNVSSDGQDEATASTKIHATVKSRMSDSLKAAQQLEPEVQTILHFFSQDRFYNQLLVEISTKCLLLSAASRESLTSYCGQPVNERTGELIDFSIRSGGIRNSARYYCLSLMT